MHPSTAQILTYFEYDHLPRHLQAVSAPICGLAHKFASELEGPELTTGLRKLLEAKDCFVRAALELPDQLIPGEVHHTHGHVELPISDHLTTKPQ